MNKVVFTNNNENTNFYYIKNFLNEQDLFKLSKWLKTLKFISGKTINEKEISRDQIFFHKNEEYFCNYWKERYERWKGNKYHDELIYIQNIISNYLQNNNIIQNDYINSCLINRYLDGKQFIPHHQDNKKSFGENPIIIGLSIGANRDIEFKNLITKQIHKFSLENNSLFIMSGASQRHYTHSIPESNCDEIRYSLTFRKNIIC